MASRSFGASYYAIITGPVLDCREISASAKLLYSSITSMTEQTGYCWASNRTLAERFGWGERTVSRLISELERQGFICYGMYTNEKTRKQERRIFIGNEAAGCVAKIGDGRQNCRGGIAKNGDTTQYREEKEKGKREKKFSPPPELWDRCVSFCKGNAALEAALFGFLENRAVRKNPLVTDRALSILLGKLTQESGGRQDVMAAMLDKAVLKNWDSVFPLKPDEMPQQEQRSTAGDEEGVDGL